MLDYVYKLELISNFYIIFYGSDFIKDDNHMMNLDDIHIIDKIINKLNNNQVVNICYNNDTIDVFTIFLSLLLKEKFNMKIKNDRINLCIVNKIVINPLKI